MGPGRNAMRKQASRPGALSVARGALLALLMVFAGQSAAQGQATGQQKSKEVLVRVYGSTSLQVCQHLTPCLVDQLVSVGAAGRSLVCTLTNGDFQLSVLVQEQDVDRVVSLEGDWNSFVSSAQVPCGTPIRISTQTEMQLIPKFYSLSCDGSYSASPGSNLTLPALCCPSPPPSPPPPFPPPEEPPSPPPPPSPRRTRRRNAVVTVPQLSLHIFVDPSSVECATLAYALETIATPYGLTEGKVNCSVLPVSSQEIMAPHLTELYGEFVQLTGLWPARLYNRVLTRIQQSLSSSVEAFVRLVPLPCLSEVRAVVRDSAAAVKMAQAYVCGDREGLVEYTQQLADQNIELVATDRLCCLSGGPVLEPLPPPAMPPPSLPDFPSNPPPQDEVPEPPAPVAPEPVVKARGRRQEFSVTAIAVLSSLGGAFTMLAVIGAYFMWQRCAGGGVGSKKHQGKGQGKYAGAAMLAGSALTGLSPHESDEWHLNILHNPNTYSIPEGLTEALIDARCEVAARLNLTHTDADFRTRSITLARQSQGVTQHSRSMYLSELIGDSDDDSGCSVNSTQVMNEMNVFRGAGALLSFSDVPSAPASTLLSRSEHAPGAPTLPAPLQLAAPLQPQLTAMTAKTSTVMGLLDLFNAPSLQETGGKVAVTMAAAWPTPLAQRAAAGAGAAGTSSTAEQGPEAADHQRQQQQQQQLEPPTTNVLLDAGSGSTRQERSGLGLHSSSASEGSGRFSAHQGQLRPTSTSGALPYIVQRVLDIDDLHLSFDSQRAKRALGGEQASTSSHCAASRATSRASLTAELVELDPRDVQILTDGLLGQGAFGTVYTGLYRGQAVAIKVLNHLQLGNGAILHQKDIEAFRHELALLSRLTHPNIVHVLGGCAHHSHPFLVMELMPGCLHRFIHGTSQPLSLRQVLKVARDVAGGLNYLHPGIVHRDLKPANILIDDNGTAKISDFGLARCKLKPYISTQQPDAGSVAYMAPECFDPAIGRLSAKCDVYSFGVLLWEMLKQEHPWAGDSNVTIIYKVAVHRMHPPLPDPSGRCPVALIELLAECMSFQPHNRPDMPEVLARLEALLAVMPGAQEGSE